MIDAVLLLKVGLAPLLILLASFAAYRWGNTVSGWIVGLPLTSAPVIFFLALERGDAFASGSAQGALMGLVSLSAFSLSYCILAMMGAKWVPCMLSGWGVYFLCSLVLEYIIVPLLAAFAIVLAWLLVVSRIFPAVRGAESSSSDGFRWGDVTIRIVAAVALIFAITEYAPTLGPSLSGLLTPFPIYTSVLVSTIHRSEGVESAARFLRGATLSLFTPAAFWLVVGSTIVAYGVGVAYVSAIVVSLVLHGALLRVLKAT